MFHFFVVAGFRACAKTPFFATIVVASFMKLIDKIIQQPNKLGNYIDFGTGSLACGYQIPSITIIPTHTMKKLF
jgi:hypothetical protein